MSLYEHIYSHENVFQSEFDDLKSMDIGFFIQALDLSTQYYGSRAWITHVITLMDGLDSKVLILNSFGFR